MSLEDRALGVLRVLIKELQPDGAIARRGREIRERAERAGVRIMDEVVSIIAQRRVRTHPRQPWEKADELDVPRGERRSSVAETRSQATETKTAPAEGARRSASSASSETKTAPAEGARVSATSASSETKTAAQDASRVSASPPPSETKTAPESGKTPASSATKPASETKTAPVVASREAAGAVSSPKPASETKTVPVVAPRDAAGAVSSPKPASETKTAPVVAPREAAGAVSSPKPASETKTAPLGAQGLAPSASPPAHETKTAPLGAQGVAPSAPPSASETKTAPLGAQGLAPSASPPAHETKAAPLGAPEVAPSGLPPSTAPTASKPEAAPKAEPDDSAESPLPSRYSSERLVFVARDPEWGHAYWEIELARINHAMQVLGGGRALIRLLDGEDGTLLYEGETWAERGRYYLRFPEPDQTYAVELVLRGSDHRSITLARSATLTAPPGYRRPHAEPRFVDLSAQRAVLERAKDLGHPPRLAPTWTTTIPTHRARPRRATAAELEAAAAANARANATGTSDAAPTPITTALSPPAETTARRAGSSDLLLEAPTERSAASDHLARPRGASDHRLAAR